MVKKSLTLYYKDASGRKHEFPNSTMPARLESYTYSAKRMGNAPTIQGTLQYKECLDDYWLDQDSYAKYYNIFVEYQGEEYYIDQTPTSSKDNTTLTYKHELNFVSERIILEHTFFLDVVSTSTPDIYKDRVRSYETKFQFYGNLIELASRINDSLIYTGTGYSIDLDNIVVRPDLDLQNDTFEISFDGQKHFEVLNQMAETFEVGYYFDSDKVIHIDEYQDSPTTHVDAAGRVTSIPVEYGSEGGLLSVTKTNSNEAVVDRITGVGGDKNIPYYYPNPTPYGELTFVTHGFDKSLVQGIQRTKLEALFPNEGWKYKLFQYIREEYGFVSDDPDKPYSGIYTCSKNTQLREAGRSEEGTAIWEGVTEMTGRFRIGVPHYFRFSVNACDRDGVAKTTQTKYIKDLYISRDGDEWEEVSQYSSFDYSVTFDVSYPTIYLKTRITDRPGQWGSIDSPATATIRVEIYTDDGVLDKVWGWYLGDDKNNIIPYKDLGVIIKNYKVLKTGDWIDIMDIKYVQPMSKLMPYIYFQSQGKERFYNADNEGYNDEELDIHVSYPYFDYPNPYRKSFAHEHKEDFDDIYPTIRDMENVNGKLIGEVVDVAFDDHDDDTLKCETESSTSSTDYNHPYFYMKINKTAFRNGSYSFNLFDQAIENETMKICMTSGDCAGCEFEVKTWKSIESQETGALVFRNPIKLGGDGSPAAGDWEDKILRASDEENLNPTMQDTSKADVWLVLSKEDSTFSHVMPNKSYNCKPKGPWIDSKGEEHPGDSFVITGMTMPQAFIHDAEQRLEDALINYMQEHNEEVFNFSAHFSRVYIAENDEFFGKLNENSKVAVEYNGKVHDLYVTSYSCKGDNNCLYDVTIELGEEIRVRQNAIEKLIATASASAAKDARKKSNAARSSAKSAANVYIDTQINKIKAKMNIIDDSGSEMSSETDASKDDITQLSKSISNLDNRFLRKDTNDNNGSFTATFGKLAIGGSPVVEWDATNKAFKFNASIYSTGEVSAYKTGSGGESVLKFAQLDKYNFFTGDCDFYDNTVTFGDTCDLNFEGVVGFEDNVNFNNGLSFGSGYIRTAPLKLPTDTWDKTSKKLTVKDMGGIVSVLSYILSKTGL